MKVIYKDKNKIIEDGIVGETFKKEITRLIGKKLTDVKFNPELAEEEENILVNGTKALELTFEDGTTICIGGYEFCVWLKKLTGCKE